MKPDKKTKFLPLSEIGKYVDEKKYFCTAVVFSPETENEHFIGCPPYIEIMLEDETNYSIYFEVPGIIAYYAKTHPAYTMAGLEKRFQAGRQNMAEEIKRLLNII